MAFPPGSIVIERLREKDAEVHSIQLTSDRSVLVFDASFPQREAEVKSFPALFAMMCLTGGGSITRTMADHVLDSVIEPGDIGISAPSTPGYEITPEMRVIGFGVEVRALANSLGDSWPASLRPEAISVGDAPGLSEWVEDKVSGGDRPELTSAGIVVSGGRGVGSEDDFALIEKLADKLGAAVLNSI